MTPPDTEPSRETEVSLKEKQFLLLLAQQLTLHPFSHDLGQEYLIARLKELKNVLVTALQPARIEQETKIVSHLDFSYSPQVLRELLGITDPPTQGTFPPKLPITITRTNADEKPQISIHITHVFHGPTIHQLTENPRIFILPDSITAEASQ